MRHNNDFQTAWKTSLLVGMSSALICTPAQSQTAAQPSSQNQNLAEEDGRLEEIIVTSQRRSKAEALQRVPIAVTAVSGQQIDEMHAANLTDIGRVAPNVSLTPSGTLPGTANFFIRGMGINTSDPSGESAVGVFIDGLYYGTSHGIVTSTFDLESVEVLRGPQGTLFGRNVTAGAVVMQSRRPTGEFGARGKVSFGNFDQISGAFSIEGPIVTDVLNAKLAVMSSSNDGLFENAANPSNRIGRLNDQIFRPMIEFTPTEQLTLTVIAEIGEMDNYGTAWKNITNNASIPIPPGKFVLANDLDAHSEIAWENIILEGNYELANGSIKATLTSRDVRADYSTDVDSTSAPLFHFIAPTRLDQTQETAEIIYNGSFGDHFGLTAGANYFQQDLSYSEGRYLNFGNTRLASDGRLEHETSGAFAEVDFRVGDLTFTAGGRYTVDKKAPTTAPLGQCNLDGSVCNYSFSDEETWSDFSPKAGIRWQPTDDSQLYLTYTKGFRGGGYGLRTAPGVPPGPYDPEDVTAYELGVKSEWLDRRLRANFALFRNDFDDLQRVALDDQGFNRTLNAAAARIQGAELEITVIPVRNLTLNAAAGYTDAEYLEYSGLDLTGDGGPDPALAKRLLFAQVPEWTYNISADYAVALGDASALSFRTNYFYFGSRATDDLNRDIFPAYNFWDGSIAWSAPGGTYTVSVFGKNLTNEAAYSTGGVLGPITSYSLLPPRTYGVELAFKF